MRRDLIALPDDSKVWVYQASQPIDQDLADAIKQDIYEFTMQWKSHGHEMDCYGHLFHYQFLVLVADSSSLPSGCSIDSSVHFVKALGEKYNIDFFDRMKFVYMVGDDENAVMYTVDNQEFKAAVADHTITMDTMMFNNLVDTKETFLANWIIPLQESWHKKFA